VSRSKRKARIFRNVGNASEKFDKQIANRRLRAANRSRGFDDGSPNLGLRDVSDIWAFAKDGKHYWKSATAKDMSK